MTYKTNLFSGLYIKKILKGRINDSISSFNKGLININMIDIYRIVGMVLLIPK